MHSDLPVFTISLDFELYWGIFDRVPLEEKGRYFENTRQVIPEMLAHFEREEIRVTWATVGMLFANDWDDWTSFKPKVLPDYENQALSSYRLQNWYAGKPELAPYLFAPALVDQIKNTPYQEMATHTYSHYYCREAGQTVDQFRSDLQAAKSIAARKGAMLHSMVFPRNQLNEDYLKVCFEEGIKTVRSNPVDWFWDMNVKERLLKRLFRSADAYVPVGAKTSYKLSSLQLKEGLPLAIPASRLLRPIHPKYNFLNRLRLKRVLREMTAAAKARECYHLWWHPHNFGDSPRQSLQDLVLILNHFMKLKETYGMVSMSMLDVYHHIQKGKA
ncbi:polysaccharide deacetylase [Pontibacter ummariensis]|uniref:Polysaccharide deacetylase n=1 Tax=Pontibacter ummariensis TaxID=1610492 RepID=A0A239EK28_9BACT|nr:polysaccharide deacetylase family protein [Pontibacter ummariensis]PRY13308.1 polysaccharide deacetylase [Pontibacter ummariensis]SNS45120.1 Polysaccharide deacetylase [Pontibacter ummariensis]